MLKVSPIPTRSYYVVHRPKERELGSEAIKQSGRASDGRAFYTGLWSWVKKKMRIGVDHLAASERVDCEEIKDIAMYGGEGQPFQHRHCWTSCQNVDP